MPGSQNFATYLRTLRILYLGIFVAQVLVCILCWYVQQERLASPEFQQDRWLQTITTISLLILGGSLYFTKKWIDKTHSRESLQEKFAQYRTGQIISWASLEGVTLLNAICYYLSGRMEFLYIAGGVIALYASKMPFRNKIINELRLSPSEEAMLDDPNIDVLYPPGSKE